ncbi:hypothetical protein HC028_12040 [Planosporangium flavigriseum]|uniref:Uncharacterized protein n=1 Tax=Planosporangium flavigriseum TaxID=373681 RepID=A0A8J3PLF9_9ACTN|nr:hypothetical protein [Planosporangium flavigriseum]NJC65227.1 hypothetical protein [Planosporangium flavigriseum]GIG71846.1 hypothetical protein Pfl04_02500 [Planosporangium flavigriseum]
MGTLPALLPSPLLGPATWQPVSAALSQRGWPVRTLPGQHLHMLVDPDGVAAGVDTLLDAIGVRPTRRT